MLNSALSRVYFFHIGHTIVGVKTANLCIEAEPYGKETPIDSDFCISQLASIFGLPRSTLLHYDRIGMLKPSRRIGPNYRVYTRSDPKRLEQIWRYRRKGMFLATTNAGIKR
jgi:hypothetical protein